MRNGACDDEPDGGQPTQPFTRAARGRDSGPAHPGPVGCRTTRVTAPDGPDRLDDIPDLTEVAPADARALSGPLFERLDTLEEGTPEHSYVRNTLVELDLTLVRHAAARLHVRRESLEDVLQILDPAEVDRGLRAANGYRAASLDVPVDDGEPADALADHIRFDDRDPERVEELTALGPLVAALPERDRTILSLRFVHDMSQARIGAEPGICRRAGDLPDAGLPAAAALAVPAARGADAGLSEPAAPGPPAVPIPAVRTACGGAHLAPRP
ncbi:sigma factor-like helix-turn-helix DNA-binding protein [Streptomyces sp. NPDC059017]|uniref:sigma factor-like helix-turn-helix DNA-binding protein n=1 Tax=Streptomyces sp. NPDC059017 TaxID=3346700 RepID=UPI0036C5C0DC